jgi:hypothetical protein
LLLSVTRRSVSEICEIGEQGSLIVGSRVLSMVLRLERARKLQSDSNNTLVDELPAVKFGLGRRVAVV